MKNQAFIDGQNLRYSTINAIDSWEVDLTRFRVYLKEKYKVDKAYYFLGAIVSKYEPLYRKIQEAGYILIFREHNAEMTGKKKGNVDTDIVFTIMEKIAEKEDFDNIILVSGDGDYIRMVKYLIRKNRFEKLLAPSHLAMSSLYKSQLDNKFYTFLDFDGVKNKIRRNNTK